jgi:glycosyltransferase involved in cell wall biosynthesis
VARSICFYTDSRILGGAERSMFMLLESLDRDRWRPALLLEDADDVEPLRQRAAELEVPVRSVGPLPLGLEGARRVPRLVRTLRGARPDVFHAHMSSPLADKWGLAAAVAAGVPAVLGTVQVISDHVPEPAALLQLRLLARGVDRYLAVSSAIAEQLVRDYRWPGEKIEVVYNAVDLDRVDRVPSSGLRDELAPPGSALVITVARLSDQKGHPALLEAAAEIPGAVFALVGDGPEREHLQALAAELGVGDRVRFLGRREDVPELLAVADVFALPSLYEGSSLAVMEAMAARRAIVSSRIGGTDELIDDGRTGLLVPPGDSAALATALRRLLDDLGLRDSLAAAAREEVERRFTRTRMAHRVEAAYAEVLGDA